MTASGPNGGYLGHELGINQDRVAQLCFEDTRRIHNAIVAPLVAAGKQAANHRVLFGENGGFESYTVLSKLQAPLRDVADVDDWAVDSEIRMGSYIAKPPLDALAALAILWGEEPSEHQDAVLKGPVFDAVKGASELVHSHQPPVDGFRWADVAAPLLLESYLAKRLLWRL